MRKPTSKPAHARAQIEIQHIRSNTLARACASAQKRQRTRIRNQRCNKQAQTHLRAHAQAHKQACARAYAARDARRTHKHACVRMRKPRSTPALARTQPEMHHRHSKQTCVRMRKPTSKPAHAHTQPQMQRARSEHTCVRMCKPTETPAHVRTQPKMHPARSNTLAAHKQAHKQACARAYATREAAQSLKHTCARMAKPKSKLPQVRTRPEMQHARSNTLARACAHPQERLRTRELNHRCNTNAQIRLRPHAQAHKQACARANSIRDATRTLKYACVRMRKPTSQPAHVRTHSEMQPARANTLACAYASPQACMRTRIHKQRCNADR
jgi:hypothetical protein